MISLCFRVQCHYSYELVNALLSITLLRLLQQRINNSTILLRDKSGKQNPTPRKTVAACTDDYPMTNNNNKLAFRTHGSTHSSATDFLNAVGDRSTAVTRDTRDTSFQWQRISVLLQRFNAILTSETFVDPEDAPDL